MSQANKQFLRMRKNRNLQAILITGISVLLLITFSCKKELSNTDDVQKRLNHKQVSEKGSAEFVFEFPDTVFINKIYNGKILYKGIFDTITTSFNDEKKSRYISYYMTQSKNKINNLEQFYKIKLDTFGAINNRIIPFYDIKFKELGTFYIQGFINDHVLIDSIIGESNPTDEARYVEKIVIASHKVIVINKPKE